MTRIRARGGRRGHATEPQAREWPHERAGGVRVLVEEPDGAVEWAVERLLGRAGFETAFCRGPAGLPGGCCPLVEHGECALAAGADVVITSLELSSPRNQQVVRAIKRQLPDTPLVVEAPKPLVEHSRDLSDLVQGCRFLPYPATPELLIEAATLSSGGGSRRAQVAI